MDSDSVSTLAFSSSKWWFRGVSHLLIQLHWSKIPERIQSELTILTLEWYMHETACAIVTCRWVRPSSNIDARGRVHHHHRSAVVHGCRRSATELPQLPPFLCLERTTASTYVEAACHTNFFSRLKTHTFSLIAPPLSVVCKITVVVIRQFNRFCYLQILLLWTSRLMNRHVWLQPVWYAARLITKHKQQR